MRPQRNIFGHSSHPRTELNWTQPFYTLFDSYIICQPSYISNNEEHVLTTNYNSLWTILFFFGGELAGNNNERNRYLCYSAWPQGAQFFVVCEAIRWRMRLKARVLKGWSKLLRFLWTLNKHFLGWTTKQSRSFLRKDYLREGLFQFERPSGCLEERVVEQPFLDIYT